MSSQHNVGAHHWPGEAHTWCQFSPARCFSWLWSDLTTPALPRPGDFSIGSARGDKIVLPIGIFLSSSDPPLPSPRSPTSSFCPAPSLPRIPLSASPGVYLGAMGKGEANDSQWLLISTICSALGPLISERKSNMWRESDRQKLSLANRPIVCWRSAFKHEGPSNSFSVSLALPLPLSPRNLRADLCRSQLRLLICSATESKYFITFSNKQLVWAHEVSSYPVKRAVTFTFNYAKKPPSFWSGLLFVLRAHCLNH